VGGSWPWSEKEEEEVEVGGRNEVPAISPTFNFLLRSTPTSLDQLQPACTNYSFVRSKVIYCIFKVLPILLLV